MACFWEHAVALPDGQRCEVSWLSWPSPLHDRRRRWELRRILATVGYETRSHRSKVCNRVRMQKDQWQRQLELLGVPWDEAFGVPVNALQHGKGFGDLDDGSVAEEMYWIDTRALFALLLFWRTYRRGCRWKSVVDGVAEAFVKLTVDADSANDCVAFFNGFGGGSCTHGVDGDNSTCVCFEGAVKKVGAVGDTLSPQSHAWAAMAVLGDRLDCVDCSRVLSEMLTGLSEVVDELAENWGNFNLHKAAGAVFVNGRGKRCRTDPHIKAIIADDMLRKKRFRIDMF